MTSYEWTEPAWNLTDYELWKMGYNGTGLIIMNFVHAEEFLYGFQF